MPAFLMRTSDASRVKVRDMFFAADRKHQETGEKLGLTKRPVAKAISRMIVDHSNGLHECIANRRANECEPPAFQVPTQGLGDRRVAGNVLGRFPAIANRSPFDELPNILVKAADFLLNEKKRLRI